MEDVAMHSAKGISRGFGINGSGVVVGDSTFGKDFSHAAVFSNGSSTDLGTLKEGGNYSRANGINTSGQVVGSSSKTLDGASSRAFIVNMASLSGTMIDLGTLGGPHAQALAINDSGFVTGNSQTNTGDRPYSIHAFLWHAATGSVSESLEIPSNPTRRRMLDLGALDGDFSCGTSISSKNHVAGYSTINNFDDRVHAFLYNGEKMIDLGSLGGASLESDRSYALGVNSADQVVGYSYLSWFCLECDQEETVSPSVHSPRQVAFIYEGGFMLNLNDLIGDAAQNYRLDCATAINDKGQIVAIAYDYNAGAVRAVLLTPLSR
jgi:probable HAF family extracellular repeat protein